MRVAARGKAFLLDGAPFLFRGLRSGPWPERSDHPRARDLRAIPAGGYTVVVTEAPSWAALDDLSASGLRFMIELDALAVAARGVSRREGTRLVRELATHARQAVRPWGGDDALLGVVIACPPGLCASPQGAELARRAANTVAVAVHDTDPTLLAGWKVAAQPHQECPPEMDFMVADFDLSTPEQLGPALLDCHRGVGDRPLVLGTVSLRRARAEGHNEEQWWIDTAIRYGAAGTVAPAPSGPGTTVDDADAARFRQRTVRDLEVQWPSISVVINAYNAEATLEECLSHCDRLDYPGLELIVVDDGSTDATSRITREHPKPRLVTVAHAGLAAGRNVGYREARGDLVAYLDADAYPSPEWPWYLAVAASGDRVGGAGGPNVPPADDQVSARIVARSPGGPVPQLARPDRAAHLPGCNMAFRREVLQRLGGFDPVLEGAEDVAFESRVIESGWELGYHPAALVWHHRRPGVRPYLRQQRHYGRSWAILERRCPERFPGGYRVRRAIARLTRSRNGMADAGTPVSYLSLPGHDGPLLELAHQWGMPIAVGFGVTFPLALVRRKLGAPAAGATAFVLVLFVTDFVSAGKGHRQAESTVRFRAGVASLKLLRPLAFRWGHLSGRWELRRTTAPRPSPRPTTSRA